MSFQLAYPDGVAVPPTIERKVVAGADWKVGSLLLVNASDEYAECGADPASIYGVAATPYGPDTSGFNILAQQGFPPGFTQVIKAKGQVFSAEYVGALPAAPGGSFGVLKGADGKWRVDFNEVAAPRVRYLRPDNRSPATATPGRVIVNFIDTNLQDL